MFEARIDSLVQIIGRALTEPAGFMREIHKEFFAELSHKFIREIGRTRPDLSETVIQFRFFYSVSTMIGTVVEPVRLEALTGGKFRGDDLDTICAQLTSFVVAGYGPAPK